MISINIKKELNAANGKICLDINENMIMSRNIGLYGHSGCGKTTLLKIISGLTKPDEGMIVNDSIIWHCGRNKISISPQKRETGFAFQDFALFPNMSVKEHLKFVSSDRRYNEELLCASELKKLENSMPSGLSHGQKQRLSLIRSLAVKPRLLLLDEPFSALDQDIKNKLIGKILYCQEIYNFKIILVSHNIDELIKMTDHVMVIRDGKIIEKGSPEEVFFAEKIHSEKIALPINAGSAV